MKKISIIIVTYNSEKDIYDCISSIKKYADIPWKEIEVIVVDNNSKDVDVMFSQLRDSYDEGITLISNTHNGGYGQGNNVGIRACSAPIIMIMNPDVRLIEPVFQTALHAFSRQNDLAIYGMKQMLTLERESRNSIGCTTLINGYLSCIISALCNRLNFYLPKLMYLQGSCFFLRKNYFEAAGLFDENIFMYGEEEDIHHRLVIDAGRKSVYNPQLHYIHKTLDRQPNLEYEKKLLNAAVRNNLKWGWTTQRTVKEKLRSINLLLVRERLKGIINKHNPQQLEMLRNFKQYLIVTLQNYSRT